MLILVCFWGGPGPLLICLWLWHTFKHFPALAHSHALANQQLRRGRITGGVCEPYWLGLSFTKRHTSFRGHTKIQVLIDLCSYVDASTRLHAEYATPNACHNKIVILVSYASKIMKRRNGVLVMAESRWQWEIKCFQWMTEWTEARGKAVKGDWRWKGASSEAGDFNTRWSTYPTGKFQE